MGCFGSCETLPSAHLHKTLLMSRKLSCVKEESNEAQSTGETNNCRKPLPLSNVISADINFSYTL